MKFFTNLIIIASLSIIVSSCLKDDDKTLVLPKVVYAIPIDDVVPLDLQNKIEVHMPIYKGSTPPNVQGTYLANPLSLVFTSDMQFNVGYIFADEVLQFSDQGSATHVLKYKSKSGASKDSSDLVSISGSEENFTAYFTTKGESHGVSTKTVTIISGTKTATGIADYYLAFVMLEKGSDTKKEVMAVNDFRIFKDGNGLASNTTWTTLSKSKKSNAIALESMNKCASSRYCFSTNMHVKK